MPRFLTLPLLGGVLWCAAAAAQPARTLDLATVTPDDGILRRVYGSVGSGRLGVPVAGGADCDGDGFRDVAVAYFSAPVSGMSNAGEVDLVFGDGTFQGFVDTSVDDPSILRVVGAGPQETAGNEVWIDDVTGDGLGDLLIGRQNFTPEASRIGAGALTIVPGGKALRDLAADLRTVDLASPPPEVALTTFVGASELDRLGIWMRTGDVDGDGVADIVVAADQEDLPDESNRGAVYVIRGGSHLAGGRTVDLADFGATALAGHIAKITPPPGSAGYHAGATCQIADLDGNGRGEVLFSAALFRGGASIRAQGAPAFSAEASGGSPAGTLYIAWDDNFPSTSAGDAEGTPGAWPAGFSFDVSEPPGSRTILDGGAMNRKFGEEILGGLDYDADGRADLFLGDLIGGDLPDRPGAGLGLVVYDAAALRGLELDVDDLPAGLRTTAIFGPSAQALSSDTAAQGDWNGDGVSDLAVTSPYASPQGRVLAGVIHIYMGRPGGWPETIDSHPDHLPSPSVVPVTEIQGGRGQVGSDRGDTLGYSATAADLDGDGLTDLIANEMQGNGLALGTADVGNLIAVDGAALAPGCLPGPTTLCLDGDRFALAIEWRDFGGQTGAGRVVPVASRDSGLFWFFDPGNWEVLVKVLDGCAVNGRYWVFAAATTNVEYTLRVKDTRSGVESVYFNPLGTSAPAITDTSAFATCP